MGAAAAVDARTLVDGLEQVGPSRDVFRRSQEQPTFRPQRVVENRDQALLQTGIQIDEQIAAHNHVHARKWRVLDQIVVGDANHVADRLGEDKIVVLRIEIAIE